MERDGLLHAIGGIEAAIDQLASDRMANLVKADIIRDRLWPVVPDHKGRRPPAVGRPPLPPVQPDARPIAGRALRSAALAVLRRHGTLGLPDLHARLHQYGYVIDSTHATKVLADAMGYEVESGRAVRISWGV